MVLLCWVTVLAIAIPLSAHAAAERVALVIGNSEYASVPSLDNPRNDASDIGSALERLGFEVTRAFNLDARSLNIALRDFSRAADDADMAIVYFAGHGMEIDNRNYLIPVDARIERASDVAYEAVEMPKFLRSVQGAQTLRLVLLDACRDNPFLVQMADAATRSLGRGLGTFEPQAGVLVGYSAKGGTVALDGDGRNSPYAEALLAHLEVPGLEIGQLFRRVRDTVLSVTRGQQEPFTYGSLPARDIFLKEPQISNRAQMLQAFVQADLTNSRDGWRTFIEEFSGLDEAPDIMDRARQKLAALEAPAPPVATPEPARPEARREDGESPLIRACDQLAADPGDTNRPDGVPGITLEEIDKTSAITACTLAVSGHPESGRSHYQLFRALRTTDERRARRALERAIDLNYPMANGALGRELLDNPGDLESAQLAVNMLEAAIEAGDGSAARYLGDFFSRPASRFTLKGRQPVEYYKIAARAGDVEAMYEAGYRLISFSISTDEELREAARFLVAAGESGNHSATIRLANFYLSENTREGFKDPDRGIELLEFAAEGGSKQAARELGARYKLGKGVTRDLPEAATWIRMAAIRGDTVAMVENGYFWEEGIGAPRNPGLAAQAYYNALLAGNGLPYQRQTREWDRDIARSLQQALQASQLSRYRGPIDGVVGPGTRAAMQRLCVCRQGSASVSFDSLFADAR